jgi:hypothetical protein
MTVFGHGERMRYGLVLITLLCCSPALAREHGGGMAMHSIGPERMARVDPHARIIRMTPLRRDLAPVHQEHVNVQDERRDILTGLPVRSTEVNDPNMILTGTPSMEPGR